IQEVAEDSAASIAEKAMRLARAQPAWATQPLSTRRAAIARFVELIAGEQQALPETLTREVGKPIRQSESELAAFKGRIEFFLEHTEAELAARVVHRDGATEEVITQEPLGLIGNISAWNYPYFVGGNVFLPALLTG